MSKSLWFGCVVLLALTASLSVSASIEKEPVKVTRQNSGPRYDFDEVEKTKLNAEDQANNSPPQQQPPVATANGPQDPQSEGETPITGHVTLRRIFLIPLHMSNDQDQPNPQSEGANTETIRRNFEFRFPSPMMRPNYGGEQSNDERPTHYNPLRHLFGSDDASRSPPMGTASSESMPQRERESGESMERPIPFDPIQMMLGLMHQALQESRMRPPMSPEDLNKEATSDRQPPSENEKSASDEKEGPQLGSIERPVRPVMPNETKEEIVEIEGKKYLKKTMLTRHVGENFVFMTRRLLFVPVNETEAITTTTPAPSSDVSTTVIEPMNRDGASESSTRASESTTTPETATSTTTSAPPTTTTSLPAVESEAATTTTAATASPSTEAAPAEELTTKPPAEATSTTTGKESLLEKVSEAIDKAAERLVEGAAEMVSSSTTTERPSVAA